MQKFSVAIKSGTCGWACYDNCDLIVQKDIETVQLPSKGDTLLLYVQRNFEEKEDPDNNPRESKCFIVDSVQRAFMPHGEFNTIYVRYW